MFVLVVFYFKTEVFPIRTFIVVNSLKQHLPGRSYVYVINNNMYILKYRCTPDLNISA